MTRNDQLETVIRLAATVETRSDREQSALMELAWMMDRAFNASTVTNQRRGVLSNLVGLVDATRVLEEGDRTIPRPKTWARTWERWSQETAA